MYGGGGGGAKSWTLASAANHQHDDDDHDHLRPRTTTVLGRPWYLIGGQTNNVRTPHALQQQKCPYLRYSTASSISPSESSIGLPVSSVSARANACSYTQHNHGHRAEGRGRGIQLGIESMVGQHGGEEAKRAVLADKSSDASNKLQRVCVEVVSFAFSPRGRSRKNRSPRYNERSQTDVRTG